MSGNPRRGRGGRGSVDLSYRPRGGAQASSIDSQNQRGRGGGDRGRPRGDRGGFGRGRGAPAQIEVYRCAPV